MSSEIGLDLQLDVPVDSTAAKGMLQRRVSGKIKHLDVGWCWIQQTVENGDIKLVKIDGKINPADFLTKPKSAKEMRRLSETLNYDMPTRKEIDATEESAGVMEVSRWMLETIRNRSDNFIKPLRTLR